MVEYDGLAAAQKALVQLNGQDIYANCCTLRIEYAKVPGSLRLSCLTAVRPAECPHQH